MSDYLGHLLERSFAPAPDVRPQIPSLFEPKPTGEQTTLRLNPSETSHAESVENVGQHPPAKSLEEMHSPHTNECAPVRRELRRAEIRSGENSAPADSAAPEKKPKTDPLIALITRPALQAEKPVLSSPIDPIQSLSPKETSKTTPVEVSPGKKHEAQITSASENLLPTVASQVVVDFHIDDSERRYGDRRPPKVDPSLQQGKKPVAPREVRPAHSVTPSLTVTSSPAKNNGREEQRVAAEAVLPPSIQVTIGRVEIRAHTPPPVIARSAPRKESGLSLENYLQRRSAGGSS